MSDVEILDIIKKKRQSCYGDYEFNIHLQMRDQDRQSYEARKKTIIELTSAINVYDDLISLLERVIKNDSR